MRVSLAKMIKVVGASVLTVALVVAILMILPWPPRALVQDPALEASDPGSLRGDEWDRRAARAVERSRGIQLTDHLADPGGDLAVVSRLFDSRKRTSGAESTSMQIPNHAAFILLMRRARAAYVVAARAMEHPDPDARQWGLDAIELLEGRCQFGPSPVPPGPPHVGPERDRAIAIVGGLFLADPNPDVRANAIYLTHRFPKAGEPSTEAVVSALAKEPNKQIRSSMLRLLAERQAPAEVIFGAALEGFKDPVTVSVAIYDLFIEENRAVIESAYDRGDVVCRAGIGETFYRHQTSMPWAESVVFKGLADPDHEVRERFAKGSLVLRPPTPRLRKVLESLRDETKCAAWALRVMDGAPGGCAGGDD